VLQSDDWCCWWCGAGAGCWTAASLLLHAQSSARGVAAAAALVSGRKLLSNEAVDCASTRCIARVVLCCAAEKESLLRLGKAALQI